MNSKEHLSEKEIVKIFVEFGMSPIEADKLLESKGTLRSVLYDLALKNKKETLAWVRGEVERMVVHREDEQKNNNIYRVDGDALNDIFIEELEAFAREKLK